MPEGDQDHSRIPMTVTIALSGLDQLFDLARRQVFALAVICVRSAPSRYCSLFAGWQDQSELRLRLHLPTPSIADCSH